MNTYTNKTQGSHSQSATEGLSQMQVSCESTFQLVDNRPEALAQRKLQEMANNSPQGKQSAQLKARADRHSAHPLHKTLSATSMGQIAQRKEALEHKPATGLDMELGHFMSGKTSGPETAQQKAVKEAQSRSCVATGDPVLQPKWYHTTDSDSHPIYRWIDEPPSELKSIWSAITNLSIQKNEGYIKLVYQSNKGPFQFLYNGNNYQLIGSDGEIKDGYPPDPFESLQSVFDALSGLWAEAYSGDSGSQHVGAGEAEGFGRETLNPEELAIGSLYTIINRENSSQTMMQLDSQDLEANRLMFKSFAQNLEINDSNIRNFQILEYVASELLAEPFPLQQPDPEQAIISESVLHETIYGYNMEEVLRPHIERQEIVVQGKFLGPGPTYNAPNFSKGIIQAPIGGGGAPAGNPPGWNGGVHPHHQNRGHLMGKQFGGIGGLANLVTLTDGSNHPQMSIHENFLAATIVANPAKIYAYKVTAHYLPGWKKLNSAVATGGGGKTVIGHPAPHHVTLDAKEVGGAVLFGGTVTVNNGIFQNHAACVD